MIERSLTLHGAEGKSHGQRPVARVQPACLGVQGLVGIGAALEDPAQHRVRADARRGNRRPPRARGRRPAHRSHAINRPGAGTRQRAEPGALARPRKGPVAAHRGTQRAKRRSAVPSTVRQTVAAEEGGRIHRPPAGRLHLDELQRTAGTDEQQAPGSHGHANFGLVDRPSVGKRRALHAEQRPVRQRHARAYVGVQGTHDPLLLDRRAGWIEEAIRRADLLGVGDALLACSANAGASSSTCTSSSPPSACKPGASDP